MDENEFWAVIDRSRAGNETDTVAQEEALELLLRGRSRYDLRRFESIYRALLARAYRWDVWGAGYVLNGGMGDESFDYFRDWLIGRGRAVFEQVLADPDSLAGVPGAEPGAIEAEGLRYAMYEAYHVTYDEELPRSEAGPTAPGGRAWDADTVCERFPRLAAKAGRRPAP